VRLVGRSVYLQKRIDYPVHLQRDQSMPKQKPLVCQHLENLSREVLRDYKDIIREYVRHRHGVYALYRKTRLYYVGLASNLRSRLNSHLRDRHADTWDRFSIYLTVGDEHLRELESLVMRISTPKGNRQKGKFSRSEDLRRRFRRQVAQ
jgi:GIY-YIG catalytic domain